ncbi:GNAT family N-acetyltransferase [Mycobacterium sp. 21AC1]|uniref:GNAT family N-acetyltransferase n=1 Tax=[Mycobacterium] appelbergii TaxID=2939269 RepID=UPI00293948E5|nr:GNAT family N-acetyltransferase [Mycobacterium sp. 21AC1]MDV3129162.1 GNAT family N-acetyltransferase [Mycobacterium sp. 21AC1]
MTTATVLRPATLDDLAAIERVVDRAFRPYLVRLGREPAPMTADHRAAIASSYVVLLTENDSVVGVLVAIDETDHLLVETVAVDPDTHGRGYGRRLMDHAEHHARRLGHAQVRLYTNAAMTENLSLYPHLGYTELGRATRDGFSRVYFVKRLTDA